MLVKRQYRTVQLTKLRNGNRKLSVEVGEAEGAPRGPVSHICIANQPGELARRVQGRRDAVTLPKLIYVNLD